VKGNTDGTHRAHLREEKSLNMGSVLHDSARQHIAIHPPQEISGRPETDVWPRHKTRSAELTERLGGERFRRRHTKAGPTISEVP